MRPHPVLGKKKELISFTELNGINYTEVYRRLNNGLSFSKYGYQLEPQWKMQFLSDDSISVFSPIKHRFLIFPLTLGYDSIFNTARAWLKVKTKSKDSLVVEILKAADDSIEIKGSKVYMIFYANNYVKNVLHTDTETLRRPSHADTVYIRKLSAMANQNLDSAFAARDPAVLKSKSPLVTILQTRTKQDILNDFDNSDDYMEPEFNIHIYKAYAEFNYSFAAYVDYKGVLHYIKPLIGFPDEEFKKSYTKVSKAIMDSYLKFYLDVTPGSTLGIKHTSMITINVTGTMKPKPVGEKPTVN